MSVVTLYGTPHQRYVALGNIVYEADGAGRIPDVADNHAADLIVRGCMDEAMWLRLQAAHPAGLPSGGTPGQVVTNTAPGAGDWETPSGGSSVGPAGAVQMSDGAGAFAASTYLDSNDTSITSAALVGQNTGGLDFAAPALVLKGDGGVNAEIGYAVTGTGDAIFGAFVELDSFGSQGVFDFATAGGVPSAPVEITDGIELGTIAFKGWDGSGYQSGGYVSVTGKSAFSGTPAAELTFGVTGNHTVILDKNGALNVGPVSGPAVSAGDVNISGDFKKNGVAIGGGGLPSGGSVGQPVVNTGSGAGGWDNTLTAALGTSLDIHGGADDGIGGAGAFEGFGGDDAGAGPGSAALYGGASNTTGLGAGAILLNGGTANVGDAQGGDVVLNPGAGHGTGRNGVVVIGNTFTPASSGASGATGAIVWDSGFIYICVAPNTWKRAAIATW
jgi:hypothetical protein